MKNMRIIRDALIENANKLFDGAERLFEMDVDKDALYAMYLDSFPAGTNEVFRKRREFDCSRCRSFIKDIGAIVRLKNGKLYTIWGFDTGDDDWNAVFKAMDTFLKSAPIKGVYLTNRDVFGCHENWEYTNGMIKSKENALKWEHFYLVVPEVARFVPRQYTVNDTIDTQKGEFKARHDVFKRSLEEIKPEAVQDVLDLIADHNLYRGEQNEANLKKFKKCQEAYGKLKSDKAKDIYCWDTAMGYGETVSKIRNSSIGTLLVNLSEGMPLERAVKAYEAVTAPANYKRPNALFTQRTLEEAQKTIEALGFMDSLQRRMATLDDITVNDVLFADRGAVERMTTGKSLFDELAKETTQAVKKPVRATKIKIEDFIKDVLPKAKSAELYLESKFEKNLCSLIAPVNPDAPTMFKWPNAISWAYAGNMADSEIKRNVAKAGGKVNGVLRCSLQWNDGETWNRNDMDLHCDEKLVVAASRYSYAASDHIFFGHKRSTISSGWLDIDIISPNEGVPAVENITYDKMPPDGKYLFSVDKYSDRGGRDNFKVEIEYAGHRYQYEGKTSASSTQIATVTVKDGQITGIKHHTEPINSEEVSHEMWGVHTGQYVPISLICYSPNAWDGQCIGNKHYMIMLKGCKNPEEPNAWYNEYLIEELVQQHKRVFEALASKAHVEYVDDQLSGVGFSSTQDAEFFIRITDVDDKTKVYKVAVNS